jgi:hypothetical protein
MAIEFFLGLIILNWVLYYFKYFDLNLAIFFTIFLIISWIVYIYRWKKEEGREEGNESPGYKPDKSPG